VTRKKISIITPAYNEEEGIAACVEEVRRVMTKLGDRYDYEHIVADNCSRDGTVEVLRKLAAEDPKLKVIVNARNFGAERSSFNALRYVTGDAVIGIMADMQEPPSLLFEMVPLWEQGNEVVYGVYKNPNEFFVMRLMRRFYYWLIKKLSNDPLLRDFTGFALLDRVVVDEIVAVDDFSPYIRGLISTIGFRQAPFHYDRSARKTGKSKHGLAFLFDFGINGIISHSMVPIRAATIAGVSLFALSILGLIVVLILRFARPGLQAPGITTVVMLVMFFFGVQLLFLGIMGEYIGAIHSQVRRKPFVVVRETLNMAKEPSLSRGILLASGHEPGQIVEK
jgi:glycosyltransferase involved in cell wall biosynthesis